MLLYDEAHEIPFSRPIAKGISWSDMNYIPLMYLYQLLTTKTGCSFFASNDSPVITGNYIKQQ